MARGSLGKYKAAKAEKSKGKSPGEVPADDMKIDPISIRDQFKGMARDLTFGKLYGAHTADKVQPRGTRDAEAKAEAEANAKKSGGTGAGQSQAEKRADAQAAQANQNTEALAVKVTEGNSGLRSTVKTTMGQTNFLLKSIDKKMSLLLEKDFGGGGPLGSNPLDKIPLKGALPWIAAAATMVAAGAAFDGILGKFGVGKDKQGNDIVPDKKKDDENWDKMSGMEKFESGTLRLIEGAGRMVFLGNMVNEAQQERIGKESKYLDDKEAKKDMSLGARIASPDSDYDGSKAIAAKLATIKAKTTPEAAAPLAKVDPLLNSALAKEASQGRAAKLDPSLTGDVESEKRRAVKEDIKTKGSMGRAVVDLTVATMANTETLDDQNKKTTDLTAAMDKSKGATMGAISSLWSTIKDVGSGAVETGKEVAAKAEYGYKEGGLVGAAVETTGAVKAGAKKAYGSLESGLAVSKGLAVGKYTDDERAAIESAQMSGEKFKAGSGIDQVTKDKITAVAAKHGVPAEHLMAMAQMESGGNKNAVSSTGAAGLFQFTGGTGKQYGVTNRFDPDQNIDAAARLYKDNRAHLEKQGIEASMDNMYIAHQQGAGGAAQILKAAQGKGQISATVAKNIGLNVGGSAGSPQGFLDENKKHLAAASLKASTYTAPQVAKDAPTQVARVDPLLNSALAKEASQGRAAKLDPSPNVTLDKEVDVKAVPTQVAKVDPLLNSALAKEAAQGRAAKLASTTVQATVSAGLPEKIQPSLPAESQKVSVANLPPPEKKEPPVVIASGSNGGGNSQVIASLQDIPIFFPDVSLMPLLRGMV